VRQTFLFFYLHPVLRWRSDGVVSDPNKLPLNIVIDAVNWCPLHCTSCPQGRREVVQDKAKLKPDQLRNILSAFERQAWPIRRVNLFNWGEPLLNPMLPELVRVAKHFAPVGISTTGNHVACDIDELLSAGPDFFIISTSGMTQAIYETTHEGGSVDKFIAFCRLVAHTNRLAERPLNGICLTFHRYKNNLHEEPTARALAKECGFKFVPLWATELNIENFIKGQGNQFMVLTAKEQLAIAAKQAHHVCPFNTAQLAILHNGDVRGCSVTSSMGPSHVIGNVFWDSVTTIMTAALNYSMCGPCVASHAYKVACGLNTGVDKECSTRSGAGIWDSVRHLVERTRKRVWSRLDGYYPSDKSIEK
jgi:MoaA/NifB/PqqE/SkfB family radical SAM enzyme